MYNLCHHEHQYRRKLGKNSLTLHFFAVAQDDDIMY